jgi:ADP-ribosylglycohydrolase
MTALASRIRGCLLGGAVGDALGAAVEFDTIEEIRSTYGPSGITAIAPPGHFTDDTQMTLFTVEALLIAGVLLERDGVCNPIELLHHAYLRWLATQAVPLPNAVLGADEPLGWLLDVDLLHRREAPGTTCITALASGEFGTPMRAINDSKGCGGVMRAAPGGILVPGAAPGIAPAEAYHLGCEIAAVTHGHPDGIHPSGALSAMVCVLLSGEGMDAAVTTAIDLSPAHQGAWLRHAAQLGADAPPSPEVIEAELGSGWVGDEALAIAVACAVGAKGFDDGVIAAANHTGDADSTAAICGNLLGADLGLEAIDARWLADLDGTDVVASLADDVVEWVSSEPQASEQFSRRYGIVR